MPATTEIEAVNIMLSVIGEAPINSLEGSLPLDASIAKRTLDETSRRTQTRGWHFNTEDGVPFQPDISGMINLPNNILRIDLDKRYASPFGVDPVQRGNRLYDRGSRSYIFSEVLECEVVYQLPFNELPEAARTFIVVRAARLFAQRQTGADSLDAYTAEDEKQAMVLLMETEENTGDYNIFAGDTGRFFQRLDG